MIEFSRKGSGYLVIDHSRGIQFELTRAEGEALARFLMLELNVWDFRIYEAGEIKLAKDENYLEMRKRKWGL